MLERSGYLEEVRDEARIEARIEMRRQDTLEALEVHFPGAVPSAVVQRVKAETNLDRLGKWLKFAVKADLQAIQQDMS